MSLAEKHPSPDQKTAIALQEEMARALIVFAQSQGFDSIQGQYVSPEVHLSVRGKLGSVALGVSSPQGDYTDILGGEPQHPGQETETLYALLEAFGSEVLGSDFNASEFKVSALVEKLDAFFAKQGQPRISNSVLTAERDINA